MGGEQVGVIVRTRYVQIKGELIPVGDGYEAPVAPLVMPDIQPYKSMADGSIIKSRSEHREHLKRHGCIEIGNEVEHLMKPKPIPEVGGLKELYIREVQKLGHEGFKRAVKHSLDQVRWNSRGR